MDRTVKLLLGVIAASLLMLNLQLAGVSLVSEAHAGGGPDLEMASHLIAGSLQDITRAINRIDCGS